MKGSTLKITDTSLVMREIVMNGARSVATDSEAGSSSLHLTDLLFTLMLDTRLCWSSVYHSTALDSYNTSGKSH